ncbi:hypothetical protein [Hyphomicrobium sp.]|uniref:hypothetical protein n=1 Tax=Hyphomicrobium sp. TaxID=82 RepID=UPI001DB83AD2|nr:hypothetical protein [Hyphomicrobium sp.]MBY0559990.1 hypothetical protein [Hyphomicrobium sp.]
MTTISAETILRSRNRSRPDKVLTTLLLRYPRWIHAEFLTHRAFSRNAASSRAIPVEKIIADIMADPAVPLYWGKNQKGMQASEECNAEVYVPVLEPRHSVYNVPKMSNSEAWLAARDLAVEAAEGFVAAGYHKQIVNRLLEPFAHITTLVSATEWDNFLELRDHAAAEPHFQILAQAIRKCLDHDVQELSPGDYHLPFVTAEARLAAGTSCTGLHDLKVLSIARCASTSYKTVDGFEMTQEKAQDIYAKLVGSRPVHASPSEHVAFADFWDETSWTGRQLHGNFVGFCQSRFGL